MREVFGERGFHLQPAARAIKPTEVGDAATQLNHDKTLVNKGRIQMRGYPHRGDRCGDRVTMPSRRALSLKKGSSPVQGTGFSSKNFRASDKKHHHILQAF